MASVKRIQKGNFSSPTRVPRDAIYLVRERTKILGVITRSYRPFDKPVKYMAYATKTEEHVWFRLISDAKLFIMNEGK